MNKEEAPFKEAVPDFLLAFAKGVVNVLFIFVVIFNINRILEIIAVGFESYITKVAAHYVEHRKSTVRTFTNEHLVRKTKRKVYSKFETQTIEQVVQRLREAEAKKKHASIPSAMGN